MKVNKLTVTFTTISIIICTLVLRRTGEPRPIIIATAGGILMSLVLNMGLVLISFDGLKRKFKKIFTAWMIISLVGITFTVGGFFPYSEYLVVIFHIWLICTIWRKNGFQVSIYS